MKRRLLIVLSVLILGFIAYSFFTFVEMTPPSGQWQNPSKDLGKNAVLTISAADKGQGIRTIEVTFERGEKTFPLYSGDYSQSEEPLKETTFEIPLDFRKLGIKDGEGVIAFFIQDRSLWNYGKGNSTRLEHAVVVDTRPPMVEVLSTDHVVLQGGSEITIYKSSADTKTTGVKVGEYFFPAHSGVLENKDTYVSFFSYPYDLPSGEPLFIVAEDRAGNTFKKSLPILVKPKSYRKRTIEVTDEFIERKIPEVISFSNLEESGDLLEDFLLVNRELRRKQEEVIKAITKDSMPEFMWKEGFLQFKNTKVEAKFADFRTYMYNGNAVDKQYHLGYDLAATKRFPVGASNGGVIVFADNLGIYGNTVVIDHGLGIFTSYSHMSSIDVNEGDRVEKGAEIGRTGETGLAGGDHLHFGVHIHGTPVTPVEWWDEKWVENRILRRIRAVGD
jgi:murein DD-endopeptidase MepM/ murein hydrolase activator NlpD